LEEIKSRLNIVDVIGEYLRLEKAGVNWKARCPFHNEKTPSFMVNEEKQIWHCFGCQKGGDVFSFVMEMDGLDFRESLKILAERAGVSLSQYQKKENERPDRTREILELAARFYEVQLWKGQEGKKIIEYLLARGLNEESIKNFRLGYAPKGWRNIAQFLTGRGYAIDEIKKTGLLVEKSVGDRNSSDQQEDVSRDSTNYKQQTTNYYDRFRERIMFPISDVSGKVVGFSARVAPGQDESQAKYVNTPETAVYHKGQALYGINLAKTEIKRQDSVIMVEGNLDVIATHQAGLTNTVAVSGTALTREQLKIIKRYTSKIYMFFDMDEAGMSATRKSLKLCFEEEMAVRVVNLPKGKDAADLAKENPKLLAKTIKEALPAMEYLVQDVFRRNEAGSVEGKKVIVKETMEILVHLNNDIERDYWIKILSERLNVKESLLTDIWKKVNLKHRKEYTSHKTDVVTSQATLPSSKKEMLIEELVGFALFYSEVWRMLEKKENSFLGDQENELLSFMIEKGEDLDFEYDKLSQYFEGMDLREQKAEIDKLFLNRKYRIGLDNSLEEFTVEAPQEEAIALIKEIKKETVRETLDKISNDMKLARNRGDIEAEKLLQEESGKIIEEFSHF